MIISHKYKYIFLKTNKTAGTSIEIALSKYCGDDDIITPISPVDEEMRKELGGRLPQNYEDPSLNYAFYNHMPAREIRPMIGDEIWNEYYKFCFERNPWDRVISLYYWFNRSEPRPTMLEFLGSDAPSILRERGYDIYTINDEVVVDKICRYEQINKELDEIGQSLGLPEKLTLPNAKAGHRKDKRHYRDIFDEASKKKIDELLDKEIKLLGYTY